MSFIGCIKRHWRSLTQGEAKPDEGFPAKPKTMRDKVLFEQRKRRLEKLYREAAAKRETPRKEQNNIVPAGPMFMAKESTNRVDETPVAKDDGLSRAIIQHMMLDAVLHPGPTESFFGHKEPDKERAQDAPEPSSERFDFDREEALNGYDSGHNMPTVDPPSPLDPDRFSPADSGTSSWSSDSGSSYGGDTSSSDSSGGSYD